MITITDVLAHISEVSGGYSGNDRDAAMEEYWQHYPSQLGVSITTDVEKTELQYMEAYGRHDTVYFKLRDYQQGLQLASELHYVVLGERPAPDAYSPEAFSPTAPLYLFVHIRK